MKNQATDNGKYTVKLINGEDPCNIDTTVFSNMIGQDEVRKVVSFYVNSHSPVVPCPTMLFTGSKGLGKSYTAVKVAQALGRRYIEINCESIQTEKDFIEGVMMDQVAGSGPVTLLLDESHRLTKAVATVLLSFLNPNVTLKNTYNYNGWPIEYDFSKINIIFATTDAHRMDGALLNRCEEVYFSLYTNDELYRIIQIYLNDITLECDKQELSEACRGRARNAFKLSQNIIREVSTNGNTTLGETGWGHMKEVFSIYPMGLNSREIELLNILKKQSPLSCRNIAVRLGVTENNVEGEIEIRPREIGLIENTSRGRQLTPEGMEYIESVL